MSDKITLVGIVALEVTYVDQSTRSGGVNQDGPVTGGGLALRHTLQDSFREIKLKERIAYGRNAIC